MFSPYLFVDRGVGYDVINVNDNFTVNQKIYLLWLFVVIKLELFNRAILSVITLVTWYNHKKIEKLSSSIERGMMMMMIRMYCKEVDVYTTALFFFFFMIQCSYQITRLLFAINRQEGKREREKVCNFIGWREGRKFIG